MDLTTILTQMLVLFFLMILGLIAQRFGIMDQTFNARLSNLLIKLAVPCMILASVGRQNPFSDAGALIRVLTVSALVNAAAPFLAHLFVRLLRVKEERNLYQFMFSLTNAGFMGLPVIQSIFGDTAMDYAAIFLLPNNFLAYVYGIRLFQKQVRLKWKQVFNSPVVCSILACGISLFHLQEPAIVYQLTDMVGDITTPLAMLIIGASSVLSFVLSFTGLPQAISSLMLGVSDNKIVILLLINIILLIVGTFMDMAPALLIFTPIFLPVVTALGMSPVHFGIMIIMNLSIGTITPPVGSVLFVGCSVAKLPVDEVMKQLIPFFLAIVAGLILVTFIPALSMWLPGVLGLL